jgi:hypothetical protein
VPGVIGVAAGWVLGALIGYGMWSNCSGRGCPDADWMAYQWIPVIGPWLSVGLANGGDYTPFTYVTGILQDVGLILLILGIAIRDEWDEPVYAFGDGPDAPRLYLSGSPTTTGGAMSATLTF